jgi:protein involved in polysaccharide export with SLBB domain
MLPAQTAEAILPEQQCSGPLAAVMPECRSGAAMEIPATVRRPSGMPAGSPATLRTREARPEATPQPVAPPAEALQPQAPTEFQRFAASSLGTTLPIYGADLFEHVPTTFAPLDRVPVTADYVVGPGDEILLRAWGQINLDLQLTVDRAGAIYIPQAGNISVAGLQFQQLGSYLRAQLGNVFRNFDLNVNMGQLRSIQVFVVGQARRPGSYTVSSLSTLINALFASGGPASLGSMRHIQLRRDSKLVTEFDLYDLLQSGDKSKDSRLLPGDVVYIPQAGRQIAVAGSVNRPAIYELSGEKTVGDAIRLAGGLSAVADAHGAILERIDGHNALATLDLQLDARGLATPVSEGDVLHVSPIVPRFVNAVTLRGNVANPGRFPWRAGMRLRDVIPDKEVLITREYWKKHNLLGSTARSGDTLAEHPPEAQRKPERTSVESQAPEINWSYAVIERQNPRDLQTDLIPFHLGKLVLEKDEGQNLELRAGDVVTIFSQDDIRVARAQQNRMVRLEGEFAAAGIYSVHPGETLGQLIQRAGGLTAQAYLFGSEFSRESTRADQQVRLDQFTREMEQSLEQGASNRLLASTSAEETAALNNRLESQRRMLDRVRGVKPTGRVVLNLEPGSNDSSKLMELSLEDGDRFMVPARPSTVNVLGAVYNQNAFIYESKARVGDYLRQAGGATRDADKSRAFVIRADGSVVPSASHKNFENMRLNPGDSLVMPEALFKTSFMRGLRDWTQVFSQLALGAAAINVLR